LAASLACEQRYLEHAMEGGDAVAKKKATKKKKK
jgi:hypothetical protein